jgi:hypothetical protein
VSHVLLKLVFAVVSSCVLATAVRVPRAPGATQQSKSSTKFGYRYAFIAEVSKYGEKVLHNSQKCVPLNPLEFPTCVPACLK